MIWFYTLQSALAKRLFPERARRWRKWKVHDPESTRTIDHEPWSRVLEANVAPGPDRINRVRYGTMPAADRVRLSTYLERCRAVPISTYGRNEQFAFWINLYNALTVQAILACYPVRSFRNAGLLPSWLGGGPWDRKRIAIEGVALSLNDIEHRILRRNWRDPRIHYAVNCGALGCPDLQRHAYRGAAIDDQLDAAAARFINSPRGARLEGDRLIVCRIFSWFKADFGGTDTGILDHLRLYAMPELNRWLHGRAMIDGYEYDWSLNDARDR